MTEIAAIDFFTVPSLAFKTLDIFVVHFNVTSNPTAAWTSLQMIQAFPFDSAPRYLIRDRDGASGQTVG